MKKAKLRKNLLVSNDKIIQKFSINEPILKTLNKATKYVLVSVMPGTYIRVSYKRYRDFSNIEKVTLKQKISQYIEDDDVFEEIHNNKFVAKNIVDAYNAIKKFVAKEESYSDYTIWSFYDLFEFNYKVKIFYKDGTKEKLDIKEFMKEYFTGIAF